MIMLLSLFFLLQELSHFVFGTNKFFLLSNNCEIFNGHEEKKAIVIMNEKFDRTECGDEKNEVRMRNGHFMVKLTVII